MAYGDDVGVGRNVSEGARVSAPSDNRLCPLVGPAARIQTIAGQGAFTSEVPAWTVLLGEAVWQALIIALSPFAKRAAADQNSTLNLECARPGDIAQRSANCHTTHPQDYLRTFQPASAQCAVELTTRWVRSLTWVAARHR